MERLIVPTGRTSTRVSREERRRRFPSEQHPYRQIEAAVRGALPPGGTLLDIGCGREATRLRRLVAEGQQAVGVDVDAFSADAVRDPRVQLLQVVSDRWPDIGTHSVDVAYSVSVFEHLEDPGAVLAEARRVLRPGGSLFILTANLFDYVSQASSVIPNRLHPRLVALTEGRDQSRTFPTYYRANTRRRLQRVLVQAGFTVERLVYLASPPSYLKFHPVAWRIGCAYHRAIVATAYTAWLQGWLFADARAPRR